MASTADTLVPVVEQPAPTTTAAEQHQPPTTTEAAPTTTTTTSPKKTLPNINSNVNRKDVPEVKVPSPNKKKGNAPIAHAPRTAQAQQQPPQYYPGAPPPPHFYPYPPAPNGSPSAAGYWAGPPPPPGSMPPPAMYPPGMYPPPPHMFGSAAAGPYTMDPPTPQGKPPADVVGKAEEGAEKEAEKNSGVDDAKKEGNNPASEANVKATEEKGEESKPQEPSDMSIDTNKKTPGIPSVTKDKMGLKDINPADITNATPATMCETMDDITPSAFMNTDDFKHGKSVGGPTPMSIYQSHGKPVYYQHQTPEGASPFQSIGSFSAITKAPMDPMSASHYFASAYKGGHPGSSGGLKGMGMPPPGMMMPPGYSPHVYQYQHFDPRSHIEHPMPVKSRSGMPADYIVPPTVHMPSATSSGVSPLAGYSAMKPDGSKTSGTKELKSDKGSPLELLSSVTGSPLPLVGNIIHQPGMSSLPINEMQYTYDPDAPAAPDGDDADTPSKKPSSLVDLMLTAANTIDVNESKKAKRRKLSDGDVKDVKKKLGGIDTSGMGLDSECIIQAQQASQLAEQALARPRLCKRLLLSMALVRTNPRTPPSCYPSHGTVLADRFHWAAYPPLDSILRKNMKRYYELSTDKCQSRDQQEFNNRLVHLIRKEATKYGWEFDEKVFDDKKIRDRIRCFYKTHIQNAKKRLKTMLKNPEKKANIKALAAHYHLIEEKGQDEEGDEYPEEDKVGHYRNDGIRLALSKSASSDSEKLPGVGFQNSRSGGRKRTASTKYTEEA